MSQFQSYCDTLNRRQFIKRASIGLGTVALNGALKPLVSGAQPGLHFPAKAKRIIFLFMAGAPSQLDLFDYKPGLEKLHGQPLPKEISKGQRVTVMTHGKDQVICASAFKFAAQGQSGLIWSELLPHLSRHVDDICLIKSTHTNAINHDPAKTFFCTGEEMSGGASMGSWLSYGLGSLNKDLPDFVVLSSALWSGKTNVQALYHRLWGTGFLPTKHQGVAFQSVGDPVLFLSNPDGVDRQARHKMMDFVTKINAEQEEMTGDPEIRTSMAQQEMAFRMQMSVPELTDLGKESEGTLKLYGPEVHQTGSFARNCLLARRMAERDVRFVQLFHRGWDHHRQLPTHLKGQARDVDQPISGLLTDLKRRGLFEDTLVVFAGEFGRTTYAQDFKPNDRFDYGRDHHPRCFTTWMAGGGIKGGISYGETDDFCYNVANNPVHVRDLHATMFHQMGIDHNKLIFPHQGLDQKLTGVEDAHVVKDIIA
ncbi:MAG: sulfatase [Opitutaceae bacterium]|nr:sulfatase [Opitutaceae bacterium]|tara:strand:- start:8127 stop:9566 length:1440 start_codon:yes stop_codon:yes gene_type:complete